jgi:hypothetical protein
MIAFAHRPPFAQQSVDAVTAGSFIRIHFIRTPRCSIEPSGMPQRIRRLSTASVSNVTPFVHRHDFRCLATPRQT